jgi:hypothetical protein
MKIITRDIKELYVNLPIRGNLQTTKFWLNKHNNTSKTIEQILENILKETISNKMANFSYHKKNRYGLTNI